MIRFTWNIKNILKTTPAHIEGIANAALGSLGAFGSASYVANSPKLAAFLWGLGFIAKFVATLFSESDVK